MLLIKLFPLTPRVIGTAEVVEVTAPNKVNATAVSGRLSMLVFVDGELKPGPVATIFIVAVTLVMGFGVELDTI